MYWPTGQLDSCPVSRQIDHVFLAPLPVTVIINCIPTPDNDLLDLNIKLPEEEIRNALNWLVFISALK